MSGSERLILYILVTLVLSLSLAGCEPPCCCKKSATVFFVSTTGNDKWSGKLSEPNSSRTDGPFASLERARDTIRELNAKRRLRDGGVTVWIRGGIYPRESTFKLTAADSGSAVSPISFCAYRNERVQLIGGREISGFKPITDKGILARIARPYWHKILQFDLKAANITDFGSLTERGSPGLELFFRNKPMTLARWPNGDWAKIAGAADGSSTFTFDSDRPTHWTHLEDVWVHGYFHNTGIWGDWRDFYEHVKSIDTQQRTITTDQSPGYGYGQGNRYYALNVLEELDQPGEWCLDRNNGILYFWPPAPLTTGSTFVSILQDPLISLQGASHITLEGLRVGFTRGTRHRDSPRQ